MKAPMVELVDQVAPQRLTTECADALGGLQQLELMRRQAGRGEPLLLVDGLGFIWGRWVITQLEETQSVFQGNGQPLKQGFRLQLTHYGEDDD